MWWESVACRGETFRAPHHTITATALIGGGAQIPRPGECSLSHGSILFLDELPEFSWHVLEYCSSRWNQGLLRLDDLSRFLTFLLSFC
ncbi:ATP-binding protein [Brevibacillus brevis]|uniref:ATP-binding protein n=1 Tax=Brevibacillus brevis TaxID=1393 RepID=UPI003F5539A1